MISQTAEYALRAIVFLAMNPGRAYTTQQIAAGTRVPAPYLAKVLQSLVRSGLVQSSRGIGGGFLLTVPKEELTILSVLNAVDPIERVKECPLGLESHEGALCALHETLDNATACVEKLFSETTIADILNTRTGSTPLCEQMPGTQAVSCA